jgi:hypothetical protein
VGQESENKYVRPFPHLAAADLPKSTPEKLSDGVRIVLGISNLGEAKTQLFSFYFGLLKKKQMCIYTSTFKFLNYKNFEFNIRQLKR